MKFTERTEKSSRVVRSAESKHTKKERKEGRKHDHETYFLTKDNDDERHDIGTGWGELHVRGRGSAAINDTMETREARYSFTFT